MFVNTNFTFDGISGQDMYGLMIVRTNTGMLEQPFGMSRKTITERVKNRGKVYSYGFEDEVLTFTLEFYKEGTWTYEERVTVTNWFIKDKYCVLTSDDYPLEFDVVVVGNPLFYNDGLNNGYLKLDFEASAPYGYSVSSTSNYDLSNNTTSEIIVLENKSNVPNYYYYKPEIEITMAGSTSVKLVNLTDGGTIFEFKDVIEGEIIYVDCENERVYSTLSDTRLNNLTDHRFLRLKYGENRIQVTGQILIKIRMRYPMMI